MNEMESILDVFIETMEAAYGKYRVGMAFAIRQKLTYLNQQALDILADKITTEYDMARPPSLKVILTTMYNHNIRGTKQTIYSCSVCEHCGEMFSSNSYRCPHCKRLRIYGITKILKHPPPWHEAEQRQMKKDEMELEDTKKVPGNYIELGKS